MNLKEIQSLAIRERIDINLHSSLFADRPWCLITSRRTGEGEIKITLYGRDIEELLARGVEAVSGIRLPIPALASLPAPWGGHATNDFDGGTFTNYDIPF